MDEVKDLNSVSHTQEGNNSKVYQPRGVFVMREGWWGRGGVGGGYIVVILWVLGT